MTNTLTAPAPAPVAAPAPAASVRLDASIKRESRKATLRAVGSSLLTFALTMVAVVVLWVGALWVFNVSPYVGKGPVDVFNYLFTLPNSAANRELMFSQLWVTLGHSAVGFFAGLIVAVAVAMIFQLSRGAEHALMPLAMLLRSVPLVAMAPVIILIFGRDFASVAVIGGIVVLFPALVNIVFGLKSAPPQMNDLVSVYGGSSWTALRKVALPSALPSLLAAVRISVPGAITGALLAEWLAVGGGIGGAVGGYINAAQFSALWTAVVFVTATALILYNLVQLLEAVVLARMGMADRA